MIRTSVLLPSSTHQQLVLGAQQNGKNFSEFLREILENSVEKKRTKALEKTYTALRKMKGVRGTSQDATTTIDDTLYGEHGAWRGSDK